MEKEPSSPRVWEEGTKGGLFGHLPQSTDGALYGSGVIAQQEGHLPCRQLTQVQFLVSQSRVIPKFRAGLSSEHSWVCFLPNK